MSRLDEIESCPLCGALPCDWTDNPHNHGAAASLVPNVGDELYVRVRVSGVSRYENGQPQWSVTKLRPGSPGSPSAAFWMGLDSDYLIAKECAA